MSDSEQEASGMKAGRHHHHGPRVPTTVAASHSAISRTLADGQVIEPAYGIDLLDTQIYTLPLVLNEVLYAVKLLTIIMVGCVPDCSTQASPWSSTIEKSGRHPVKQLHRSSRYGYVPVVVANSKIILTTVTQAQMTGMPLPHRNAQHSHSCAGCSSVDLVGSLVQVQQ